VPITDALWKLIDDAVKRHDAIDTLNDIALIAAQAKLDVLGNPVTVSDLGGLPEVMVFPSAYKKAIVTFRLHTGRDNVFRTQLTYPTNPAGLLLTHLIQPVWNLS
jgi:hypothetical protein